MLGAGGGSGALFTPGSSVQTTIAAVTCISNWLVGPNCASLPAPFNPYVGVGITNVLTLEYNNLTVYSFYRSYDRMLCFK